MMFEELNDLLSTASANTSLGHAKRDKAFVRQIKNLCTHPGGTGLGTSKTMADAVSAYRFAHNKAVNLPKLREARFATALESSKQIHLSMDKTPFNGYFIQPCLLKV